MKRFLAAAFAASLVTASTAGCLVHSKDRPGSTSRASRSNKGGKCKPSHTWDGEKCRHKGKGKGARKHDYKPRR